MNRLKRLLELPEKVDALLQIVANLDRVLTSVYTPTVRKQKKEPEQQKQEHKNLYKY